MATEMHVWLWLAGGQVLAMSSVLRWLMAVRIPLPPYLEVGCLHWYDGCTVLYRRSWRETLRVTPVRWPVDWSSPTHIWYFFFVSSYTRDGDRCLLFSARQVLEWTDWSGHGKETARFNGDTHLSLADNYDIITGTTQYHPFLVRFQWGP